MLFDTLKKKNRAEAEEQAWNANRPADYVSQNKDAMDAVTGQVGSGFDWDTGSKAYEQYRNQSTANAAASAENARANAAALAGGYGSSYADSVAKQGQQQAMGTIDNAVPGLRSQALSEYQNSQNSLLNALSGMASTEALDRSAYGRNVANYNARQNFLANQTAQAKSENSNYWNNLWNGIKAVGNVAKSAYDGYMGYAQQQWENEFAKEQWEYNKDRTDKSDELSAYQQAFNLYQQGAGDAATDVLNRYGLNADAFANYTGAPVTRDDQASVLTTAANLVASGNTEAASNLLKLYGMDTNAAGDYNTLTQRAISAALAQAAATKTGSSSGRSGSSRSRSSSSSSRSGGQSTSPYTSSQIVNMMGKMAQLDESDPMYSVYANELAKAGIDVWSGSTETTGSQSAGGYKNGTIQLNMANKWGGTTGTTAAKSSGGSQTLSREQVAANAASGQKKRGSDDQTIYNSLRLQGYTDDEIYYAMNHMK